MKPRSLTHLTLALLLGAGLALAACEEDPLVRAPGQHLTSVSPACETCLVALVECTSTSQTEAEFVQCRDVFQSCETQSQLGPEECSNPTDEEACILCEERLHECDGDKCEAEFTVCRALLTENPERCGGTAPVPPAATLCKVCLDGLASCAASLSEGGDPANCASAFDTCKATHQLTPEACPMPTGGRACDLCDVYHGSCVLSGDTNCEEGLASCVGALSEDDCGLGQPEPEPECAHHECGEGVALDATCSTCATAVCDQDAYCCDTAWDELCIQLAAGVADCGCEAMACEHPECSEGTKLNPQCSECAQAVCEADDYCCTDEWDSFCTGTAATIPACGCSVDI
jgi:hypothetical protein